MSVKNRCVENTFVQQYKCDMMAIAKRKLMLMFQIISLRPERFVSCLQNRNCCWKILLNSVAFLHVHVDRVE